MSHLSDEIINSGIGHNTYSCCSEPHSHSVSGNERLPIRLKLLIAPSYFSLDVFHLFNSRDTLMIILGIPPPRWFSLITFYPCRAAPFLFVSTMEIPKKGWQIDHGDLKQWNEDINESDQPLRKGSQDREDSLGFFSLPTPSPLTPPLKSRDEISCSGGELWRPGN